MSFRGGKANDDCFAVRGSSLGSGVDKFRELDGLRPRAGVMETLSEGFARKSSEGISSAAIWNWSSGGGSP